MARTIEKTKERADALFKQNHYKEAGSTYEEIIKLEPFNKIYNAVVLSNQATCYMIIKDNSMSLKLLKKACEYNPNYAKVYFQKAEVESALGDYESAEQSLRRAKTLDPSMNINDKLKNFSKLAKKLNQRFL